MNSFKVGDVVVLKSGGPLMTIQATDIIGMHGRHSCIWFDEKNSRQVEVFVPETLAMADLDNNG